MIPLDFLSVSANGPWPGAAAVEPLVALLTTGLLGMGLSDITSGIADRFSEDGDEEADDSSEGAFSDGNEFADGGGFGEDFMAEDGGDDFDDWDDEGGDDLGDFGGGGGGGAADLEPRMNELENEVASVSSTMGTVRSENEAIQESVEEIEDNIRKLLEIYEMVTRGVNPFVDEVEGAAGMGGSFGLFDGEDAGGGGEDDIDPEIADADAESFFDDDWEDDVPEDDGFAEGEFADEPSAEAGSESGDDTGKTFDQLKSEYEGENAEWSEEDSMDGGVADDGVAAERPSRGGEPDADPAGASGPPRDGVRSPTEAGEAGGDGDEGDSTGGSAADEPADADGASGGSDEKPYLRTLPAGYGADLLVIEWLSYLRGCSDTAEALRALRYYETIGWIGEPAAESLTQFLTGLDDDDGGPVPGGGTQLTVDHHTNSLRYIGRLGGADVQIERLDWAGSSRRGTRIEGGEQRGIQR